MRSLKYLQLEDDAELQASFLATFRHIPLRRKSIITAMAILKKSHTEDDAVSCLVVASENGDIYVLDPEAFTVLKQVEIFLSHLSAKEAFFMFVRFILYFLPLYYPFSHLFPLYPLFFCCTFSAWCGVDHQFLLPSPAVFLSVTGLHDVDYHISAACRDNCIYTFKR